MKMLTILAASAAVLMAGAASAQEVGVGFGSAEGRDTAVSARFSPAVVGPLGTDVEFTYDTLVGDNSFDADAVGVNLVKDFNLTDRLAVYGVAGLGYAWTDYADSATYTYGAGATFDLTDRLQLDARVREIEAFRDNSEGLTVSTIGFNLKF